MRGNKHQLLLLADKKEVIRPQDLVERFSYSGGTARSYLSQISRQGLLQRTPRGYVLTDRGKERLQFFEVQGCPHRDCPRCQHKKGYYECPRCGYKLTSGEVQVNPVWETPFFKREGGIYCPRCSKRIFTEGQAYLLKKPKEREERRLPPEHWQARPIEALKEEKSALDEFFDYFMEGKT